MKKKVQSRREFFKKAAKGTLPILGAIVLGQLPLLSRASEAEAANGCRSACTRGCAHDCFGSCHNGCRTGCKYDCRSSCKNHCVTGCYKTSK